MHLFFLFFFYNFFWLEDFGNEVISTRIVLDNEALGDAINSTDPGGILTGPSCISITQRGIMNSQKYLFRCDLVLPESRVETR